MSAIQSSHNKPDFRYISMGVIPSTFNSTLNQSRVEFHTSGWDVLPSNYQWDRSNNIFKEYFRSNRINRFTAVATEVLNNYSQVSQSDSLKQLCEGMWNGMFCNELDSWISTQFYQYWLHGEIIQITLAIVAKSHLI